MEKKQQSSVFQVFILKNKLKKTEIAQYLGVSNAFNERYSNYKNYLHRMNRNLKEFGYTRVGKRGKKIKRGPSHSYPPTTRGTHGLHLPPIWRYPKKPLRPRLDMEKRM